MKSKFPRAEKDERTIDGPIRLTLNGSVNKIGYIHEKRRGIVYLLPHIVGESSEKRTSCREERSIPAEVPNDAIILTDPISKEYYERILAENNQEYRSFSEGSGI